MPLVGRSHYWLGLKRSILDGALSQVVYDNCCFKVRDVRLAPVSLYNPLTPPVVVPLFRSRYIFPQVNSSAQSVGAVVEIVLPNEVRVLAPFGAVWR
jgi:hypothetical protein